jgi:transcriptional regulator with XRE-family HTH domain
MDSEYTEIVFDMQMERRKLAGRLVKKEMERQGKTVAALESETGISSTLINRIRGGKPNVTETSLNRIEGALDWPWDFLSAVVRGDTEWIAAVPGLDPPGLKESVLKDLAEIKRRFS